MTAPIKFQLYLLIAAVLAVLLLAGCETTNELSARDQALLDAQAQRKTLQFECESACSVSYTDPRDRITLPKQTNGWDAVMGISSSLERIVSGAVVPYGFVELGKHGFDALQGSGESHVTNTDIGDYSGDNSGRVGDYSGSQSGNAGVMDSYSGEQSGNSGTLNSDIPGRIESPGPIDRSERTDNSDNSTSGAPQ